MIFDGIASDRVPVDACVRLGRRSARAAADRQNHPAEAVKWKSARFSLLVYPSAYSDLCVRGFRFAGTFSFTLSRAEFPYALLFLSKSNMRSVPIGVVGELIRGGAFYWG